MTGNLSQRTLFEIQGIENYLNDTFGFDPGGMTIYQNPGANSFRAEMGGPDGRTWTGPAGVVTNNRNRGALSAAAELQAWVQAEFGRR